MKILLVNTSDIQGGAARAAYRLHQGLHHININSEMLVEKKLSDDQFVYSPSNKLRKGLGRLRAKIDKFPLFLYKNRQNIIFSPAWVPDNLKKRINILNPDIIHLHWVAGGFLRIETLKKLNQPIIWTLHDMWAFTGGCHYDNECGKYTQYCGKCPILGSSKKNDLSHKIWKRKKQSWKDVNLTIVTPSHWLANCVKNSSLFKNYRVEVIPNGLDTSIYKPIDKKVARELLSLPQDKELILFGAINSTNDERKGFKYLKQALQYLAENNLEKDINLVVFGASEPKDPPNFGFKSYYLGAFNDDVSLALLYSAADVFVAPSLQDNLPNTVVESLACGTPCVAFDIGGMPDMIEHYNTGYLAEAFDADDLARGISWVLSDINRWNVLSQNSRKKVEREFALEVVAKQYADLYADILEREKYK
ncbi:MAG: glycosyltransferase family 4 protein [Clostridiales bacterium]|nr:glycosyltransferase family 4 protein [Clostridiales bacterium]MCF8023160.1 glycosyltransferase family 4 protein [Clostridiales bacterium]